MLLELGGASTLDAPVSGVVRTHGQFVDDHPVGGLEQLHGEHPGDAERVRDLDGQPLGAGGLLLVQTGGRRDHLVADPAALHGLDDRIDRHLAVGGPGDLHGEFAGELDLLLHQQRHVLGGGPLHDLAGLVDVGDDPHALAVVAAARGLEHDRPTGLLGEGGDVFEGGHGTPERGGRAQFRHTRPHAELVLGEAQGVAARTQQPTGLLHGAQDGFGHVLVVEGDHVVGLGEGQDVVEPAVVTQGDVTADQGRAVVRTGRQDGEVHPQGDARLVGHSGELTSTDHSHAGDDAVTLAHSSSTQCS